MPVNWKPRFFTIWTGQALSLLGSGLVQFALVWWLTIQTGSPAVLAGATLVAMLPTIVLGPIAGPLVDRWNRRAIMIAADAVIALATLWLIAMYAMGIMQVWHVYVAMLIRAAAGAFQMPAMEASTSLMVPREHLSRVGGLNQTLQGLVTIAAPVLGALLLEWFQVSAALAVDIVTALLAIVPLLFIPIPQPARHAAASAAPTSFGQDLRAGLRYVWHWPGLMAIIVMAMLINFLLNPAFALLPLMVKEDLAGDAGLLAAMEAVFGVGIIVGGIALSAWGGFKRRILTSFMGLIGLGLGVVAIGLAGPSTAWLAVVAMLLVGAMQSMTNGPVMAVLQAVVAPDMQGRVLSLLMSAIMLMSPLSLLVAAPVAGALGVPMWYIIGGLACLAMGALGLFSPAAHIEDNHVATAASRAPARVAERAGDALAELAE